MGLGEGFEEGGRGARDEDPGEVERVWCEVFKLVRELAVEQS